MTRKRIDIPSHQEFIDYIKGHLEDTGEKPSTFGRRVLGDSAAIIRLTSEAATDPRLSTMQKIDRAIKNGSRSNEN